MNISFAILNFCVHKNPPHEHNFGYRAQNTTILPIRTYCDPMWTFGIVFIQHRAKKNPMPKV
jgi:hypothetical protein